MRYNNSFAKKEKREIKNGKKERGKSGIIIERRMDKRGRDGWKAVKMKLQKNPQRGRK